MKRCYALHSAFYMSFQQETCIHTLLETMEERQKDKVRIAMDAKALLASAQTFFERPILCKDDCLYYEHALKSKVYSIRIVDGTACFDDYENPFYQLLKRKYRCLVSEEVDK